MSDYDKKNCIEESDYRSVYFTLVIPRCTMFKARSLSREETIKFKSWFGSETCSRHIQMICQQIRVKILVCLWIEIQMITLRN
ncbi:MAG: hypothetical protein ACFFCS_14100 [Candidatus Hodarchaeota archaeon]